jgi:hypothetical protein
LSNNSTNRADELRAKFRLVCNPNEAARFKAAQKKQQSGTNAPSPKKANFTPWLPSDDYEEDIINFYECGHFPHEPELLEAYKLGLSYHLAGTDLPEDYIKANFDRHHYYPAQLLSQHLSDDAEGEHTNVTALISALFVWKALAANPDIVYQPELETILTPTVLDICYEIADYQNGRLSYDHLREDTQNVIKAKHIFDVHEAAHESKNWALSLEKGSLTIEDVDEFKAMHQRLVVEKTLLPFDNPLDELLEAELTDLKKNLDDGRKVLSRRDKLKKFKVIRPNKNRR